MKRFGCLWEPIIAFENLLLAWKKARKGKRSRQDVVRFGLNLEAELFRLQDELTSQTYQPGNYRLFSSSQTPVWEFSSGSSSFLYNSETEPFLSLIRNRVSLLHSQAGAWERGKTRCFVITVRCIQRCF